MTSASATAGPFCGNCNTERPPDVASADPRPRCPSCGATALTYHVSAWDTVSVTDSVSATLTPADQDRGWERRWLEVQRVQAQLAAPRTGGMSADAVHQAVQDFMSFFGLAYHLKDALKAASPQGLQGSSVESAISNDPTLALLADLANLDKHFVLSHQPRSGDIPRLGDLRSTTTVSGWEVEMPIHHKGSVIEGTAFAKDVVKAWEVRLRGWGLIT